MCAVTAEAFAPSFMGQGLNLRQAKASSALSMKIELAPLPYDYTALEPKIGKQTLEVSVLKQANLSILNCFPWAVLFFNRVTRSQAIERCVIDSKMNVL